MTVSTSFPATATRSRWRRTALGTVATVVMSLAVAATTGVESAEAAGTPVRITPNPAYEGPAFEGWGTSLVWFANATGAYPEEVRQDLFDKVFGEDGLNLNIARYNIGGGNATDVPGYLRPGGAVEGWWNPDLGASDASGPITSKFADRDRYAAAWDAEAPGSYDFDADATQRWWLDALRDKITKWEAFSNSPPYFLTQSGYASGGIGSGTTEQLAPEDMDAFAAYLVNVVEHLEETHGIDFDTLDPFNEPNTNYWSTTLGANGWPTSASRQEGAHIGPARQDLMIKALDERLSAAGTTTDVAISAMDETNPSIFATNWNGWTAEAKDAVSQLNVHTYGTGDRVVARDIAKSADKPLWMSEVEGNWDTSGRGFNVTNIDNGIGMAGRVADDLRELEPRAWVLWQPVEDLYNMERVEKTNWGSVFIDFDCNADGNSARRLAAGEADPSCKVLTNAKYNTLRNFTHYIRPGDHLIPTDNTETTAALDGDRSGATLVHINSATTARSLTIDLSKFADIAPGATVTPIVTTESPAAEPTANALVQGTAVPVDAATRSATIEVPAKSVTTLLISGVSGAADGASFSDGAKYQLISQQSGKALTAPAGGTPTITTSGTVQASARPQVWTAHILSGEGTNSARIALENSDGRFLASQGTNTALVTATVTQAASTPALQWIPNTTDGKRFSFLNVAAQRVLDVNGQGTADGTTVGLWTSNNGANQQWLLQSTAIAQVRAVSTSTLTGVTPALPSQVTVVYGQGVERPAAVTWDVANADWSTPGARTIGGHGTDAFGAPFETTATVDVGPFVRTDPVSVTTVAGVRLDTLRQIAPSTVPAQVGSGDSRSPAAVTWDWNEVDDSDLGAIGSVVIAGRAVSNDPAAPPVPATLTVILTAATERNVAPESTPSATFTESASYPASRTINGVLDDKGWSNWRSGTKNVQDTLTYVLAQPEQLNRARIRFFKDGASATWAQTLRVEHRTGTGAWTSAGTVTVDAPVAGPAPVIDVPLNGVRAGQVRVVMDARPLTHLVVSEVELIALRPGPAGIADVAVITVDGVPLDGVTGDVTAYTIRADGNSPRLGAVAVDSNAAVRVTQPSAANGGQGSIVVTAPSGVTRTYTVAVVTTTALAAAIESAATHQSAAYTRDTWQPFAAARSAAEAVLAAPSSTQAGIDEARDALIAAQSGLKYAATEVELTATRSAFWVGDEVTADTFRVVATFSDRTTRDLTAEEYALSAFSTATPGSTTVTATVAGSLLSSDSEPLTDQVVLTVSPHWTAVGFHSPVDMNGVVNTTKGGSTVPLKFEFFAEGIEITDPAKVSMSVSCRLVHGGKRHRRDRSARIRSHRPSVRPRRRPVRLQLEDSEDDRGVLHGSGGGCGRDHSHRTVQTAVGAVVRGVRLRRAEPRAGLGEHRHPFHRHPRRLREQVAVEVHRHRCGGVSKDHLDRLHVGAGRDEQRSRGVPEVVDRRAGQGDRLVVSVQRDRTRKLVLVQIAPRRAGGQIRARRQVCGNVCKTRGRFRERAISAGGATSTGSDLSPPPSTAQGARAAGFVCHGRHHGSVAGSASLVGPYRRKYPCAPAPGRYVERRRLNGRIRLIRLARPQDLHRLDRSSKRFGIHGETRPVHVEAGSATTSTGSPGRGAGANHRVLDHSRPAPPPQWVSTLWSAVGPLFRL